VCSGNRSITMQHTPCNQMPKRTNRLSRNQWKAQLLDDQRQGNGDWTRGYSFSHWHITDTPSALPRSNLECRAQRFTCPDRKRIILAVWKYLTAYSTFPEEYENDNLEDWMFTLQGVTKVVQGGGRRRFRVESFRRRYRRTGGRFLS
jgi:hypothetical protein